MLVNQEFTLNKSLGTVLSMQHLPYIVVNWSMDKINLSMVGINMEERKLKLIYLSML